MLFIFRIERMEKLRGQRYDVLPTFPQRRNVDMDDVKPVIQVAPERPLLYHVPQIPVRRSNKTDWVGRQTLYQQVESALKGGVTCVQLREKELDEEAFLKEAFELHDLCKKYNVPFFINDNVDIAIRCHAEGIHVGQEDMAAAQVRQRVGDEMMIGVSVHSVEEALEAVRHGADCLGVGAAFSTHTKADVDVLPEGMMKAICDAVDIPVVAIGGIHKENLLRLKGTGVNGVALVSAIFGAEDIEAECRELKALAEQIVK